MAQDKKNTVLIVDDDPGSLAIVQQGLSMADFHVIVFEEGETALEQARRINPDIILLDIMLPGIDGFEICHLLKQDNATKDIPVIFITSAAKTADRVTGFELGAVDYITKPIQVEELRARIKTHLTIRNLQKKLEDRNIQLQNKIASYERAEEELKEAKAAAESANRLKSEFLANMSHEIRTPLNGILGFTDLLLSKGGPKKTIEFLDRIKIAGQGLMTLINEVLDLSKIEAGQMEIVNRTFVFWELFEYLESVFELQFQTKNLEFEISTIGDIPQMVHNDFDRIKQVLINLVSNGLKFTRKGGVYITVSHQPHEDMVTLKVRDTGIGIPPDELSAVFNPFIQVSRESRRPKGTGLGLTISRKLTNLMGGDISVQSTLNSGTEFTVTLPVNAAGIKLEHISTTDDIRPVPPIHRGRRQGAIREDKILVVEDDHANLQLILEQLEHAGFVSVLAAGNGREAINKAAEFQPQLILMDVEMPEMNGNEATKLLREEGFEGVILILSAHAMKKDIDKSLQLGANGYITKPIDFNSFFPTIDKVLKKI
ncbi:MAG: response regulator [bacterium]|nr:response regulator [bacterium]